MPIEPLRRWQRALAERAAAQPAAARALLWAAAAGAIFTLLNALMRMLAQQLDPMQTQFLRYLFGFAVLLPWLAAHGLNAYRPQSPSGQFWRGAVHTLGLVLWFLALPHIRWPTPRPSASPGPSSSCSAPGGG
jgi:drug/metabolite transporter (DMT)-like permease